MAERFTVTEPAALIAEFDATLQRLTQVNATRKEALENVARLEALTASLQTSAERWERAGDVLRSFSAEEAESLQADVERLVSYALSAVFDQEFAFQVTTRVLRGSPSIEFHLVDTSGDPLPVLGSHGGGVSQIISFVLRALIVLLSPGLRKILILDEPFSQVSADYRPRLAAFLRELVDATGLQLIVVTHDADLPAVADVHYAFTAPGKVLQMHKGYAPGGEL